MLTRKHKTKELQWARELHRLSELYEEQYRKASRSLTQYVHTKGSRVDTGDLQGQGQHAIAAIDPQAYFYTFKSLLAEQKVPRTIAVLMDVFYNVQFSWQALKQLLILFKKPYEETLKMYFGNFADFVNLQEELKEYVRGRTLDKPAADWVQGYFTIFDQWVRNGAGKEMSTVQQEIIIKIPELNRNQRGGPFGGMTNEKAYQCISAFDTIKQLDDQLYSKLREYLFACKKAAKITGLLSVRIYPAISENTYHANVMPLRKKWMIGLGVMMFALICFLGGRYTSNSHHTTIAGTKALVAIKEDAGDTTSRGRPAPIDKNEAVVLLPDTAKNICGLDISKYQGDLLKELNQLDTMHFVICKATQGTTLVDIEFTYNWKRLQQLKLIRGAYHFYMTKDDPVQQAQHFLKTVGDLSNLDIPLIIDIEEASISGTVNKDQLHKDLLTCLQYLNKHSGKKPMIYTDLSFANTWLQEPALSAYPLWLAEYSHRPSPVLPATWKEKGIVFWQKNDTFTIGSRKTDFDVFIGNGKAFIEFLASPTP